MMDFLNPNNWPPLADFSFFTLVSCFFIWKTARAFFEKKEKTWPSDALKSISQAKNLRETNEVLKEKLRQSHHELEAKQAKIDSLRAEKNAQ